MRKLKYDIVQLDYKKKLKNGIESEKNVTENKGRELETQWMIHNGKITLLY